MGSSTAWIAAIMLTGLYMAAIWDVYLGNNADITLTDVIRTWSSKWPILPLSVGMIMGHVFWCSCPKSP